MLKDKYRCLLYSLPIDLSNAQGGDRNCHAKELAVKTPPFRLPSTTAYNKNRESKVKAENSSTA